MLKISLNVPELQDLLAVMPPCRREWVNFSREPSHPGISNLVYPLPNILISPWEERGYKKHEQRPNLKEIWLQQLASHHFTWRNRKVLHLTWKLMFYLLPSKKKNEKKRKQCSDTTISGALVLRNLLLSVCQTMSSSLSSDGFNNFSRHSTQISNDSGSQTEKERKAESRPPPLAFVVPL